MKFTLRKENVIKIAQKIPYRCDDKDKKKMKEKSVTNLKIQQTICNNLNDLPKKKNDDLLKKLSLQKNVINFF